MTATPGSLYARFLRGLERNPDGDAWRAPDGTASYRVAHAAALAGAAVLAPLAPRAVGVLASRSAAAYQGVLVALCAGATVVPLSPEWPAARVRAAVDAAGVDVVVTDEEGQSLGLTCDLPVVRVDHLLPGPVTEPAAVALDDRAYVMFTSGSTGRPKGVPVTHRSIAAFLQVQDERYDFGPSDVFSQTFDLTFDCAMFDLFCAWGAGGCLVPVTGPALRDLAGAVREHGITVWYSAPSAIGLAHRHRPLAAGDLPSLRWSLFAGEAFRCADAQLWAAAASRSHVENLYGPTEATITVTYHRYQRSTTPRRSVHGVVPIGVVYDDVEHLVVDADGRDADEGEFLLGGVQITAGYLDSSDDNGRFLDRGGRRWYRTGDLVRRVEGELAYLGRLDDQVQVNGWRVQLAELDHALQSHPAIASCATVSRERDGSVELAVYHTGAAAAPIELARHLRHTIPDALVPRRYHRLPELPLNANRKIDRKALRRAMDDTAYLAQLGRPAPAMLHELLDAAVEDAPDAIAVRDGAGAWTYRELQERSQAVAAWLDAQHVNRGARVLVQLPNVRELAAIVYGCARRGVAFVPVNPDVKPYALRSVISDCTPSAVITATGTAPDLGDLTPPPCRAAVDVVAWDEPAWADAAAPSPDDIGTLIYTSGSTSTPKGVVCPQAQMTFAAKAIAAQLGYRDDDVVYCRLPLSFDYGLFQLFLACLARAELVLAAGSDLTILREVRACGATVFPAVPSLSIMLTRLGARDDRPTALRLVTNTGAALQQATIDDLRTTFPGLQVARMYGITECKRVSIMPPDQEFERPTSVGRPLPGTSVVILDDLDNPLPPLEIGQIVVDGPNVMRGYWGDPSLSAGNFRVDVATGRTRLHTGDYGWLDEDGFLYFDGRRDDTFKRKGVRMSTVEIEAAASDIAGVRAAAVLAPTDTRDLTLFFAGTVDESTVQSGLADRLEPAKVPAHVHVVDEVPLTLNGKPDKKALALLLLAPPADVAEAGAA